VEAGCAGRFCFVRTRRSLVAHRWTHRDYLQVGSFEEVLMRMSASEGEELTAWSQVMFVVRS